jgi:hypothetical protein
MATVHYHVVPHDGGWAYKLGDVFSETFATKAAAMKAAHRVAREQSVPGETATIQFQDETGAWHTEVALGSDRPEADLTP